MAATDGTCGRGWTSGRLMERATQAQPSTIDLMIAAAIPSRIDPVLDLGLETSHDGRIDLELELDLAAERTATAFAVFYRDEYAALVRIAYLILDSREQAEEIVQDAFVRMHGR